VCSARERAEMSSAEQAARETADGEARRDRPSNRRGGWNEELKRMREENEEKFLAEDAFDLAEARREEAEAADEAEGRRMADADWRAHATRELPRPERLVSARPVMLTGITVVVIALSIGLASVRLVTDELAREPSLCPGCVASGEALGVLTLLGVLSLSVLFGVLVGAVGRVVAWAVRPAACPPGSNVPAVPPGPVPERKPQPFCRSQQRVCPAACRERVAPSKMDKWARLGAERAAVVAPVVVPVVAPMVYPSGAKVMSVRMSGPRTAEEIRAANRQKAGRFGRFVDGLKAAAEKEEVRERERKELLKLVQEEQEELDRLEQMPLMRAEEIAEQEVEVLGLPDLFVEGYPIERDMRDMLAASNRASAQLGAKRELSADELVAVEEDMQRMREGMERVQLTEDAVRSLPATPVKDPEERESCEERASEEDELSAWPDVELAPELDESLSLSLNEEEERELAEEMRELVEEGEAADEIWSFEERMRAGEGSEGSEEGSEEGSDREGSDRER